MFLKRFLIKYFIDYKPEIIRQPRWLVVSKNILPFFLVVIFYFQNFSSIKSVSLINLVFDVLQFVLTAFFFGVVIWIFGASCMVLLVSGFRLSPKIKEIQDKSCFPARIKELYWSIFQGLGFWLICCLMGFLVIPISWLVG